MSRAHRRLLRRISVHKNRPIRVRMASTKVCKKDRAQLTEFLDQVDAILNHPDTVKLFVAMLTEPPVKWFDLDPEDYGESPAAQAIRARKCSILHFTGLPIHLPDQPITIGPIAIDVPTTEKT